MKIACVIRLTIALIISTTHPILTAGTPVKKMKQQPGTRTLYKIIRQELQPRYAQRLIELLHGDLRQSSTLQRLEYALAYAIHIQASLAVIKALVTIAGARVNADDPRSAFSPLMTAIDSGSSLAVIRYLIENEADVNYVSYSQSTPLVVAALRRESKDRAAVIQLLLCHGADAHFALAMADVYDSYAEKISHTEQSELWKEMADDIRRRIAIGRKLLVKDDCLNDASGLAQVPLLDGGKG